MAKCPHQTPESGSILDGDGKVKQVELVRCALVDAQGIRSAFPVEHCTACLFDPSAPGSIRSAANVTLMRNLFRRRIEMGKRTEHSSLIPIEDAVKKAIAVYGLEWVQERLVEAVRRGFLQPDEAMKMGRVQ